ncbi:hypothetical protein Ancab_011880 [Ancistrocladus abbreviatus]
MKASSKSSYADIVHFSTSEKVGRTQPFVFPRSTRQKENGHGDSPGVSASDKEVPSSPSASSSQAHSVENRLVGSSSKAITDFVVGDEEWAGRLNRGFEAVFEDGGEREVGAELGLISGPSELHIVDWIGLSNNVYQHTTSEDSVANTLLSGQQTHNRSRSSRNRVTRVNQGCL